MQPVKTFPELYKIDSKGLVRVWSMEIGEHPMGGFWHRSTYGRAGGKLHTTEWVMAESKNKGKSNYRNSEQQAEEEVISLYMKKKEREGYSENPNTLVIDASKLVKPMLAKEYDEHKSKIWVAGQVVSVQPKLDGIRAIATKDGMYTRKNKKITSCPHIEKELETLFELYPNTKFFDGELYNHHLKDDFQKITSIVRKEKPTADDLKESESMMQYHIYDLGRDDPFYIRYSNLRIAVDRRRFKYIKFVETKHPANQAELDVLYHDFMADGYEGMMVRWSNNPYEMKRTDKLLKRKTFDTDEFEVLTMESGSGDWTGAAKRFVLKDTDGTTFAAGVSGEREKLVNLWMNGDCPDWATVRFFGKTNDGIPRFPVVIDYGYDERKD